MIEAWPRLALIGKVIDCGWVIALLAIPPVSYCRTCEQPFRYPKHDAAYFRVGG